VQRAGSAATAMVRGGAEPAAGQGGLEGGGLGVGALWLVWVGLMARREDQQASSQVRLPNCPTHHLPHVSAQ
jgi:hypothetical protein